MPAPGRIHATSPATPIPPAGRPAFAPQRKLPRPDRSSSGATVDILRLACPHMIRALERSASAADDVLRNAESHLSEEEYGELSSATYRLRRLTMISERLDQCAQISRSNEWATVDTQDLITRAIQRLADEFADTRARVRCKSLPKLRSIETVLDTVFTEILTNAINYRSADPPEIEIEAHRKDAGWLFAVSDNGIGIDRKHWNSVFDPFFTVDPRAWRPGMGLTVVRLGIRHLGGDIRVDSNLKGGTLFNISLPTAKSLAM